MMDHRAILEPLWKAADAPDGRSGCHGLVARVAIERLRGRWGPNLDEVVAGLAKDETATGMHQWRHDWEQKLAARAALLLGMSPIRKRSGRARYRKVVYVMGPAGLVRAWTDVVEHFVPLFERQIEEHWMSLTSTHFPVSAALPTESEVVDATLAE